MRVEVGDLPERMHTGVGAPSAGEGYRLVGDAPKGALEHLLQRGCGCLCLPASVGPAIVFDANGYPQHREMV